jgi:hypothetical protein
VKELTTEQAKKVHNALARTLGYLSRLRERLEKVGFVPSDPLCLWANQAQSAMQALVMELHYQSCRSGVGQPEKPE